MPKLNLAIEYDGEQHYMPIEYFGGQKRLEHIQELDALKNLKISQHPDDVKYFIRFSYKEKNLFTEEYIKINLLKNNVPI